MSHKFNPFRPNNIIAPGSFVGRFDELLAIERCLFQAKHGNPQHFIAHGERGIGKSSLLMYVQFLAQGRIGTFTDNGRFNFLTISADLGTSQSQLDIVKKIARGFRSELARMDHVKSSAKSIYDWLTNWELFGVRYHKQTEEMDMEEIIEDLVNYLHEFTQRTVAQADGILILLDEADRPPSDAKLGELLKLMSERLTKLGSNNVIFGLAGLPTLLARLRESHESSPRLFHTMLLEPLSANERTRVIDIGIEEANRKNDTATSVTDSAKDFLAGLSEGYPHFIQQFSYCAFDADTDFIIDDDDVSKGAFVEGGALSQLGDKYFNEMFHNKIASDDYRIVLRVMAAHGDIWVTRRQIIAESKLPQTTVNNALAALRSRGIINYDDSRPRQGYYRLPTRSFASWINAFKSIEERTGASLSDLFSDV